MNADLCNYLVIVFLVVFFLHLIFRKRGGR